MSVLKIGEGCNFHSFTTNVYKFHYLESPAGIKVPRDAAAQYLLLSALWPRPEVAPRSLLCLGSFQPQVTPPFLPFAQIVLNTSPEVGDLQEVLGYIYSSIYVEYVIKNPLHELGDPFSCAPSPFPIVPLCPPAEALLPSPLNSFHLLTPLIGCYDLCIYGDRQSLFADVLTKYLRSVNLAT